MYSWIQTQGRFPRLITNALGMASAVRGHPWPPHTSHSAVSPAVVVLTLESQHLLEAQGHLSGNPQFLSQVVTFSVPSAHIHSAIQPHLHNSASQPRTPISLAYPSTPSFVQKMGHLELGRAGLRA